MGSIFSSPKIDAPKNDFEDVSSPLSKRGSFIPLLIGTYKVSPIVAWVGDRKVRKSTSNVGGKGTGSSGPTLKVYRESGWHILCLGPASKLHRIYENGEIIYEPSSPLTPVTDPSGSTIIPNPNKPNRGSFKIYWGDAAQPVNSDLGTSMGISSKWPRICYIHWIQKKLGSSPRWPSLEYVISTELDEAPTPLANTSTVLGNGINPAHALKQIAAAPFPYGCGMDESFLNNTSLEALGTRMQTEGVAFNLLAKEGMTGTALVKNMLEDMGVMLSPYQYDLVAVPIRNNPAVTTFSDDVLLTPDPELEFDTGENGPNRIIFTFKDAAKGYKDTDIPFDNDSSIILRNNAKSKTVKLNSVTNHAEASVVAKRRLLEEISDPVKYKIKATRDARAIRPGQAILFNGMEILRVGSITLKDRSGEVTLATAVDLYGVDPEQYTIPAPISDPLPSNAAQDLAFTFYELPSDLSSEMAIAVIRIRAHDQILGASIWASADNMTYSNVAEHDTNASGGTLDANFSASDNMIIENGPLITLTGGDTDSILDLSGDENNWRTGKQLCIINDEVFFLRNITALGGSSYQLNGLIRARYGSLRAAHTSGTQVYIFAQQDIVPIKNTLIQPGLPLYIKTQPFTPSGAVDISTVTPVQKAINGKIYRPLPPDNFRGNNLNTFIPGGAIDFSWTYRVHDGGGSAAGEQVAGDAISTTKPPPDGFFEIAITGGRTLTVTDSSGTAQYTNAQIVTDFGGEPASITATLTNIKGSYVTGIPSLIITRDTSQSTVDTTPPTPNPMTFASDPAVDATNPTEAVKMTATTATDSSGVEYFFENTSGPGNNSAWQPSATYTDSGLRPNTEYKYKVRTRDQSALQNLSGWSAEMSVLTNQPVWKGTWSTATFYAKGDSTEQGGTSYTSKLPHTSDGTNTPPNATYWEVLAQKGDQGNPGNPGVNGSDGNSVEIEYSVNAGGPWHTPYVSGDKYMRERVGTGAWNEDILIQGTDGINGTDGSDGNSVEIEYSAVAGGPWHTPYVAGDRYMRERVGTGAWDEDILIQGTDGINGTDGIKLFRQAAVPTGVDGDIWFDTDDSNRPYVKVSGTWTATAPGAAAIGAGIVAADVILADAANIANAIIGTLHLDDLVVTNAKIDNLTLLEGKIATNAISNVYSGTGGAINFPLLGTGTLAATVSGVVVPANSKVVITGAVQVLNNHTSNWRMPALSLYRDSTQLVNTFGVALRQVTNSGADKAMAILPVTEIDEPGAGTHTYKIVGNTWSGFGIGTVADYDTGMNWGQITVMVVKK